MRFASPVRREPSQAGLNGCEQFAVGVAEGAHAVALQRGGDLGEIDAGILGLPERLSPAGASSVRAMRPWSAKARKVASGIVLTTSGPISSST